MTRAQHTAHAVLLAAAGLTVAISLIVRDLNQGLTLPARRVR